MPVYTRKLVAELLGTYALLLFGGFAILSATYQGGTQVLWIAFGFGLALLVGLYAFGEVSGGHFNPAVSLAALIDKRIDLSTFVAYVIAQVAGAALAGWSLVYAVSQDFAASTATVPNAALGVGDWDAFLLEVVGTAFFVAVILKVTASDMFGKTAFLGISLALVLVHVALVPLTGSSVNPARTLGSALGGNEWTSIWVYLIGPFVGAFIGWAFYKLVTLDESETG